MRKWIERQPYAGETSRTFPEKEKTLDFIEKVHDMGWIDDESYEMCVVKMGESYDDDERIEKLELSARAYNALIRSEVRTVNQLRYLLLGNRHPKFHTDIFEIRNLGIQTAFEVMQKAVDNGVVCVEEIGSSTKLSNNFSKWKKCRQELIK